jgi:hypothetical protein
MTRTDRYEDLKARWKDLAKFAEGITPTRIPVEPMPNEIRAINDDLLLLAGKVDALIQSYGAYVAANVSGRFDQSLFKDQLFGALEGNATYEVSCAADDLAEEFHHAVA